jgi:hypothetical protein
LAVVGLLARALEVLVEPAALRAQVVNGRVELAGLAARALGAAARP